MASRWDETLAVETEWRLVAGKVEKMVDWKDAQRVQKMAPHEVAVLDSQWV